MTGLSELPSSCVALRRREVKRCPWGRAPARTAPSQRRSCTHPSNRMRCGPDFLAWFVDACTTHMLTESREVGKRESMSLRAGASTL